jgi:hypothetical protein
VTLPKARRENHPENQDDQDGNETMESATVSNIAVVAAQASANAETVI